MKFSQKKPEVKSIARKLFGTFFKFWQKLMLITYTYIRMTH
jgi:hypothetical protein